MSTTALLLGLAAGGGALYLLHKRAQAATDGSACDALCAAAAKQGIPVDACKQGAAYRACRALGDLFQGWDSKDAQNKALNGEVELALGPLGDRTVVIGAGELEQAAASGNVSAVRPSSALYGTVARFKNGCVPFSGMPGFDKCKPGTNDMKPAGNYFTADPASGKFTQTQPSAAFSGTSGDPFTGGPFAANQQYTRPGVTGGMQPVNVSEPAFPLPLANGETGYYYQGKPFKCPAGQSPQWNVRDNRTNGGPPPCAGANGAGGWGSTGPSITGKTGGAKSTTNYNCATVPADQTWDPSNGGFWRRLNAGETRNLGPCAPQPIGSGSVSPTQLKALGGVPVASGGARTL